MAKLIPLLDPKMTLLSSDTKPMTLKGEGLLLRHRTVVSYPYRSYIPFDLMLSSSESDPS